MASSSSKRAKRHTKRTKKAPSASSSGSESTAPTYPVEEDSNGELVNKRMGVVWPARAQRSVKRYPDHSSGQSLTADHDQFATSPYEMISIADLDAAAAGRKPPVRGSRPESGRPRVSRGRDHSGSPQYVQLSGRLVCEEEDEEDDEEEEEEESKNAKDDDDSFSKIDSVVFNGAEELAKFQRIVGAANMVAAKMKKDEAVKREFMEKWRKKHQPKISGSSTVYEPRSEVERHYIGVRSKRAVEKKLTPHKFYVYYEKPAAHEIPVKIELKIGYKNSSGMIYHFPIQRFECQGEPYYSVMEADRDVKMFSTIALLVQYYHTFSDVDPLSGDLETFCVPL